MQAAITGHPEYFYNATINVPGHCGDLSKTGFPEHDAIEFFLLDQILNFNLLYLLKNFLYFVSGLFIKHMLLDMLRNLTDKELIAFDSEIAFQHIYERYWESLYKKALSRLNDSEDAQDLVQEIFISLWRNKSRIQIEETLAPYLFTALKYAIIKLIYRKAKKGVFHPLSILELEKYTPGIAEEVEFRDLKANIDCEVALLPDRMKQIYKLSREKQLRNAEIARLLNISEQTVKNTLTVTLKRLRSRIVNLLLSIFIAYSIFF